MLEQKNNCTQLLFRIKEELQRTMMSQFEE